MKVDSKLVPGARRPTWEAILATGVPFLRKTLPHLGVAEVDLEDMLQDVLLATLGALERFDASRFTRLFGLEDEDEEVQAAAAEALARIRPRGAYSPICNWLFGIAWRQASHYRERAFRRRELPVGLRVLSARGADESPGPDLQLAAAERTALVRAALDRLEPQRRTTLVLHDAIEHQVTTIAREFGANRNTMQGRLQLAREDFQMAVKRMGEEKRRALEVDEPGPLPGTPTPRGRLAGRRRQRRRAA